MAEATIVAIKVQPGDKVSADQEIIEVETDKAVMGVTTPCAGEIAKIDAEVKDMTLTIGLELRRDLTMSLQGVQESLTVTGQAPVVETTRKGMPTIRANRPKPRNSAARKATPPRTPEMM